MIAKHQLLWGVRNRWRGDVRDYSGDSPRNLAQAGPNPTSAIAGRLVTQSWLFTKAALRAPSLHPSTQPPSLFVPSI